MSFRLRVAITVIAAATAAILMTAFFVSGGVDTVGDPDTFAAGLSTVASPASVSAGATDDGPDDVEAPSSTARSERNHIGLESADARPAPLLQANEPTPTEEQPVPIGLVIDRIEVDAPVVPTGVDSDSGQMAVPSNVDDVAWYRYGSSPGAPGSAVLAAHVDLASQGPGVFFELRTLEPGDVVTVDYDDGSSRRFVVEARTIYTKDELPLDAIFARTGDPVLTLVTCGGAFNETAQNYDSNVVVYAVPNDVPGV